MIQEEKNTVDGNEQAATEDTPIQSPSTLSLRDALEVAVEATKPAQKEEPQTEEAAPAETPQAQSEPTYEPPAEWNREEKDDFRALSRKQQEAALRLHRSRNSVLEQIKIEKADLEWAREIAKEVTPFLKTRGDKEPAHAQVLKAIRLVNQLDEKPREVVIDILKAKGLPIPKELEAQDEPQKNSIDPHLQQKLESIESRLAREDHARVSSVMSKLWGDFESTKNAAGSPKFPDINESESGLRMASNIGSLVSGQTDLSKQFIANVRARIPDVTPTRLFEEAYRYYGGRVDDSSAAKTQDTQSHVLKSTRAASSVPGRGGQSSSGQVKKYKTYREAAAAFLRDNRDFG